MNANYRATHSKGSNVSVGNPDFQISVGYILNQVGLGWSDGVYFNVKE